MREVIPNHCDVSFSSKWFLTSSAWFSTLQLSKGDEIWLQTPMKKRQQKTIEVLKIILKKLKINTEFAKSSQGSRDCWIMSFTFETEPENSVFTSRKMFFNRCQMMHRHHFKIAVRMNVFPHTSNNCQTQSSLRRVENYVEELKPSFLHVISDTSAVNRMDKQTVK